MIPFSCVNTGLDIEFHIYEHQKMTEQGKDLKEGLERTSNSRSQQQAGRKRKNSLNLENFSAL